MSSRAFLYVIACLVVVGFIGLMVGQSFGTNGTTEVPVQAAQPLAGQTTTSTWAILGIVAGGLIIILLKPHKRQITSQERK